MIVERCRGSLTLIGSVAVGVLLWGFTHAVTHRLLAPMATAEPDAEGAAGALAASILAAIGLITLSILVVAGSALRPTQRASSVATAPAMAVAPAVFTTLETVTHLDAHHGAPPVVLVVVGSCIHALVVSVVLQLWMLIRPRLRRLNLFDGSAPESALRRFDTPRAQRHVCWTPADTWSGRAPPEAGFRRATRSKLALT